MGEITMQILKTNKFKRCVDGTVLKEYLVNEEVTRELLILFWGIWHGKDPR